MAARAGYEGMTLASLDTAPVAIKGIDPRMEQEVTDIRGAMVSGSVDALEDFFARMEGGETKTLNLIVRADMQGALEPIGWDVPDGYAPLQRGGTETHQDLSHDIDDWNRGEGSAAAVDAPLGVGVVQRLRMRHVGVGCRICRPT